MSDLTVSFESFKDTTTIWLNQGSSQIKLLMSKSEGLRFASWLTDNEWPNLGIPLPGSPPIDHFEPGNKEVAVGVFGFKASNFQAFKFQDLEYGSPALEIIIREDLEFCFWAASTMAWVTAAKEVISYSNEN